VSQTQPPLGRPSDGALWASVAQTLAEVVLPAVVDEHARIALVQLVGLARYAIERGADPTSQRVSEVASALDALRGNPLADAQWSPGAPRDATSVMAAASALLAACVARPALDDHVVAARTVLRAVLVAQLDADLAGNAVLMAPFRGRLPDA
jgi:hypothetical protein